MMHCINLLPFSLDTQYYLYIGATLNKGVTVTLQEKIGVKKVGVKLTPRTCVERANAIERAVEKRKIKGEKRALLMNQASWYRWKARQFKKKAA